MIRILLILFIVNITYGQESILETYSLTNCKGSNYGQKDSVLLSTSEGDNIHLKLSLILNCVVDSSFEVNYTLADNVLDLRINEFEVIIDSSIYSVTYGDTLIEVLNDSVTIMKTSKFVFGPEILESYTTCKCLYDLELRFSNVTMPFRKVYINGIIIKE